MTSQPWKHAAHHRHASKALSVVGVLGLLTFILPAATSPDSGSPTLPAPNSAPASAPVRVGSRIQFGLVWADPATRTITFPARVNQTNGLIEYAVVTDYGKTHESLLVTDVQPMDLQSALLLLRARPSGTQALASGVVQIPKDAGLHPTISWPTSGPRVSRPLHRLVALTTGGASGAITGNLVSGPWLFNGSQITQEGFGAHFDGSLVSLIRDPIAIINNPGPDSDEDEIHIPDPTSVPPPGTEVIVELSLESVPAATPPAPRHALPP